MINSNKILEKKRFPYPYIIIQNFFEKEFYKNIENDFPKKESFLDDIPGVPVGPLPG